MYAWSPNIGILPRVAVDTVRLTESEASAWCWLAKEFPVGKTPRTPPLI